MLPFSNYDFFIVIAFFIVILWGSKFLCANDKYKYVLAFLNATFLLAIYTKPLHFLLLIVFSYLITFLITKVFIVKNKLIGILILLLPMLLVKLDIRFNFYPFHLNDIISFSGLSYASFRIMSYYMDKGPNDKMANVFTYFNFLSFTPTLLIGPIERYGRFKKSEDNGYNNLTSTNFINGWNEIIKGIAFKFIIAEIIDRYWMNNLAVSSKDLLAMTNNMYAYYFYIFFDFAGYSFMAMGIGRLMGIEVPKNFGNPFVAINPQDFWRRFHISLGEWLKDYFFTPLFMFLSRKKNLKPYPIAKQNISLLFTFVLMGCWNGFKFNYILSGLLFGIYSAVHNTYTIKCKQQGKDIVFKTLNPKVIRVLSILIMFNLVAFSLYIFSGRCPYF